VWSDPKPNHIGSSVGAGQARESRFDDQFAYFAKLWIRKLKENNDTRREQVDFQIKEQEDRYRSVTETSIDAVITSSQGDLILTWNKGAEHIFQHGTEIVGEPVTTIIPERYREAHRRGLRRYLETGEKRLIGKTAELQALRKDGTEFPMELSLSSWESASGVFFGGIIRDISERKQIEQIREDVQRMMRHDLKSPLIGITGLAKVIQKGSNLTQKQRKAAGLILELGEKTLRFVDRTRDLFQMEQGTYKLEPKPVNLISLIDGINKELEPLFVKRGLNFTMSISGRQSNRMSKYLVQGEESLLEIMFSNLIKNATEASPDGSSVAVSIGLENKERRSFHLIDIHNWGSVPQEIREKFFAPYSTSGKKGGSGLGTHSALLIARAHQGDIHFSTSEEEGTHVIVMLPEKIVSDNKSDPLGIRTKALE
jgi:PAS domain S-box-containing protein